MEENQVQTQAMSLPRMGSPLANPLEGFSKALNSTADTVGKIVEKEVAEIDASRTQLSTSQFDSEENKFLRGYNDEKGNFVPGLLHTVGESALKPSDGKTLDVKYNEWQKKYTEEALKTLDTDRQKLLFREHVARNVTSAETRITEHTWEQSQLVKKADAKASTALALRTVQSTAQSSTFDGRSFADQIKKLESAADVESLLYGNAVGSDANKLIKAEYLSKAYESRVDHLMVKDPKAAKNYFDGIVDKLSPDTAEKIDKTLKPLLNKQTGMDTALEYSAGFNTITDPLLLDKSLDDALTATKQKLANDPDAYSIAEAQLYQDAAKREKGIRVARQIAVDPINKSMALARTENRIPTLSDFAPADWKNLLETDPTEANRILHSIQTEARQEKDRRESERDRREMRAERDTFKAEQQAIKQRQKQNYVIMWSNPAVAAQADIPGMIGMGDLTPEDGKKIEARMKSYDPDEILAEAKGINSVLKSAKIKPGSDQELAVKTYVADRIKNSKEKPTQAQVVEFTREALYSDVSVGMLSFDKTAYKMKIDDIPQQERAAISAALQRKGRRANESNIISAYVEAQRKGAR